MESGTNTNQSTCAESTSTAASTNVAGAQTFNLPITAMPEFNGEIDQWVVSQSHSAMGSIFVCI